MAYYGSWKIDDLLTFCANTTRFDTGAATDADAVPAYRVYEDETGTPILTGTMSLLDSANTAGFYSEQITLSAANGFEKGKCYSIYISATVNSVAGATHHNFQLEAEVDANRVNWANVDNPTTTVALTGTTFNNTIKKNTALAKFMFLMTDSVNHNPSSGLTVTCTRSIDGAAFAAGTLGTPTAISNGMYYVDFGAGDLNGNVITLRCTASGADDAFITIVTTP